MDPIEIRYAVFPYNILIGAACLLIACGVLFWTLPKFRVFLRVVFGREQRKPGTKTIHLALGFVIYALPFALAAIPVGIFVQLLTQPPTGVTDQGVTGGGGLLFARTTIGWRQMERVTCPERRDHTVSRITIHSAANRIDVGSAGMADLAPVLDRIRSRVPQGTVHNCANPFPD